MSGVDLGSVLRRLRRLFDRPGYPTPTDAEVLARFVAERDEAAFELLVWRHGPTVLSLCRRMLRREQDAEDAFQAAFLTLARRASCIGRRQSVGSWLFKVAFRVALRARERAARRSVVPLAEQPEPAGPAPAGPDAEVRSFLDEEVSRLPEKYRAAVVLCYLQGKTNTEAARELGCPRGTIDSRLAWARQRLRQRLARRGVSLSLAGLVAVLAPSGGNAAVPAALVPATAHLALLFATRGAAVAGLASVPSVQLAQGVLRAMFLTKLKRALAVVLAVAAVATGSWGSFRDQDHFGKSQLPAAEAPGQPAVEAPAPPADQHRKDEPILWTPRVLASGEVALPDRVVQSDLVVSGRVVALEPKDVEAVLAAAPPYRVDYRIAAAKVHEVLHGQKDVKEIRLGFISPGQDLKVDKAGKPNPPIAPSTLQPFTVGQDGLFFLRRHHQSDFHVSFAFFGGFYGRGNDDFMKTLEDVRRLNKVLEAPLEALKAENPTNRFVAATMLIHRYRLSWLKERKVPEKAINAEESKLLLKTLAEADWQDATEALCETKYPPHPYRVFLELGVKKSDG